jgi:hypothetical protein
MEPAEKQKKHFFPLFHFSEVIFREQKLSIKNPLENIYLWLRSLASIIIFYEIYYALFRKHPA